MNKKLEYDILYYWSKIKSDKFDQETIKGLIISIRDFGSTQYLIKELGDFIAHPERTKGVVWNNVLETGYDKDSNTFYIQMPIAGDKFIQDFKNKLLACDVIKKEEIEDIFKQYGDGIMLCILGMLHFTSLSIDSQTYNLKIEPNESKNVDGKQTLCMFAVDNNGCGNCVITTELESALYIDDIANFNNNLNIRAIRSADKGLRLLPLSLSVGE